MSIQPSIAELTSKVVSWGEDAEMLATAADALGQVEPHEMTVGLRTDPRTAWTQSMEALGTDSEKLKGVVLPGEWGRLVVRLESVAALPFALGNYPQRVRELGTLVQTEDLKSLLASDPIIDETPKALADWCRKQVDADKMPQALIAAALHRVSRNYPMAERVLGDLAPKVPFEWLTMLENERATLLWERGLHAAAKTLWDSLPDTNPVIFNRGMASLFLGESQMAIAHFRKLADQLPEASAWHHLASLYLALAEMRA
ncbi:tetratricopeptide repeat protein [Zavarzinella formosa]|uniref:hypothetical protein n=1 Tax=Zavarzinella formosa TaxID=360055 RepID=UPI0002DE9077|nr:hypothetical protein [Zavarzinella formosa]